MTSAQCNSPLFTIASYACQYNFTESSTGSVNATIAASSHWGQVGVTRDVCIYLVTITSPQTLAHNCVASQSMNITVSLPTTTVGPGSYGIQVWEASENDGTVTFTLSGSHS
jgi:hypothetical protein